MLQAFLEVFALGLIVAAAAVAFGLAAALLTAGVLLLVVSWRLAS